MDMDFTMSAALWGAALATIASFTTAIGVTMAARGQRFAKSEGEGSGNRDILGQSVGRSAAQSVTSDAVTSDAPMDSIGPIDPMDNIDIPFYQEDAEENDWESIRVDAADSPGTDSRREAPEEALEEIPGESPNKTMEDGLVSAIVSGAVEPEFDKAKSERYKEEGRLRVNQWDIAFSEGEWAWDLLGQAARCYVKAIRCDPENQHAWLNLAFTYHLFGDRKKATECLEKSNILTGSGSHGSGPYGSSRDYRQVATAVQNDTTLFGQKLHRPPLPAGFRDNHDIL